MFKLPYHTTAGSSVILKETIKHLQQAIVNKELIVPNTLKKTPVTGLREVPPYLKAIPAFSHPLVFEHFNEMQYVIDARTYTSAQRDNTVRVTSPAEYQLLLYRAMLVRGWFQGDADELLSFADLPARVFIRLVSEAIVRRMHLSPLDQMSITVITAYFFFCQFTAKEQYEEQEVIRIATRISRLTAVPVEKILSILDGLPVIQNLYEFCAALKSKNESSRLESLNPGLLVAITTGSWYGASGREMVAVALEYPPYLFALVHAALNERGYQKTGLGMIVETVDKGGMGKDFTARFIQYLKSSNELLGEL